MECIHTYSIRINKCFPHNRAKYDYKVDAKVRETGLYFIFHTLITDDNNFTLSRLINTNEKRRDKILNRFDGHDNLTDGEFGTIRCGEDLIDVDKNLKRNGMVTLKSKLLH